jgi:hypothetical protein
MRIPSRMIMANPARSIKLFLLSGFSGRVAFLLGNVLIGFFFKFFFPAFCISGF